MAIWDIQISKLNKMKQLITILIKIDEKAEFYKYLAYKVRIYPIHIVCLKQVKYWVLHKFTININASNFLFIDKHVIGHTEICLNQPMKLTINEQILNHEFQITSIVEEIYKRLNEWLLDEYSNQHLFV